MNLHSNNKYRLVILFAGTLVMMVVMAKTGATLKSTATPYGIIDLEFACNASKASTVINAWTGIIPADNTFIAKINTWLDFIFLFFYAFFLFYFCKLLATSFNGFFSLVGNYLAKGALAAGIFDVMENIGMLITLHGPISDNITLLTFIFSISKWILVLAAILYTLMAGAFLLYRKITSTG